MAIEQFTIEQLLADFDPSKHRHDSVDWGPSVGKEFPNGEPPYRCPRGPNPEDVSSS